MPFLTTHKFFRGCLLLLILFGVLEGGSRLILFATGKDIKAFTLSSSCASGLYKGHTFVGSVLAPGYRFQHDRGGYNSISKKFILPLQISTNSSGFRGADFDAQKRKGTFRIFCLGGSDTWGSAVSDNESWPFYLGENLKRNFGRSVEVINAGVPGYTTFHSLTNLSTRILDFDPDMIIVSHSWNDLKYIPYVSKKKSFGYMWLSRDYHPPSFFKRLFGHSYALILSSVCLRMLHLQSLQPKKQTPMIIEPRAQGELQANSDYGLEVYRRNITSIVAVAKTHGIKVVLVNPLTLLKEKNSEEEMARINIHYIGVSFPQLRSLTENLAAILKSVAESEKVPFVNLNDVILPSMETMMDHIHPTAEGNRQIGGALFESVQTQIPSELSKEISRPAAA